MFNELSAFDGNGKSGLSYSRNPQSGMVGRDAARSEGRGSQRSHTGSMFQVSSPHRVHGTVCSRKSPIGVCVAGRGP